MDIRPDDPEIVEMEPLDVTIERLSEVARNLYTDEYSYHNWPHAEETLAEALVLADYCEEHGLVLNRRVLAAAAIFHDANFHKPLPEEFASKEHYSAHLAGEHLPDLDYSEEEIELVQGCIISTNFNFECTSEEGRALRRADLANVANNYEYFKMKTLLFWQECKMLNPELNFREWAPKSTEILRRYLAEDVTFDKNGSKTFMWDRVPDPQCSRFLFLARPNVDRLVEEIPAIADELELAA